jgi:glucose/arabinose dehydrogenase
MRTVIKTPCFVATAMVLGGAPLVSGHSLPLENIKLPAGFEIAVYADNLPGARSLALGVDGTVYVGKLTAGKIYAIFDQDRDGKADEVVTVAEGLNSPNGVAFRDGSLYVTEINRMLAFHIPGG